MLNYDIIKELKNIKARMWGTHLQDDRIIIDDAINEIKKGKVIENPNIVTIKDYANMPNVTIDGKVYVDKQIFKGYAINLLEQELKDKLSNEEQTGIEIAMQIIAKI